MLFQSSIRRELARSFGATLIVLATVVMTMTLIRTLGQASLGNFAPADVMLIMGYTVLAYMPTILSLSLFIAIISCLTRMYRDSEMVIWFASGQGPASLLRPLFRFAWPVLLVVGLLALLVLPWSNQRIETLKFQFESRSDIDRIEPGRFQESAGGTRVFFVEKDASGQRGGSNVFIVASENGRENVISARSGRVETVGTDRFLMLVNGQRIELDANGELKISEFESYGARIGASVLQGREPPTNARATRDLWAQPNARNQAELSWRIGLILAAVNFVVIGLATSGYNPRLGRTGRLLFPVFAFVVYNNLLGLGQNWIGGGRIGWISYMALLHGSVLLLALLWLARAHHGWHWRMPARSAARRRTQA